MQPYSIAIALSIALVQPLTGGVAIAAEQEGAGPSASLSAPAAPALAMPASAPATGTATAVPAVKTPRLTGGVSETVSPFAEDGSVETIPEGASAAFTVLGTINSETTNVGDEVTSLVSLDVKQNGKVVLPGQWLAHGKVTEAVGRKRLGRAGYVTIKFDKLISPDGKYVLPFEAEASTKDSTAKSIAKTVAVDSVYVSKGAIAGAVLSVYMGGIGTAIATHGISVGGGAAVGGLIGLAGALKRKGGITCVLPGEEVRLRFAKPVTVPVFNAEALPSAQPIKKIENFEIIINKVCFDKDPFGDKRSRLLRVNFCMNNQTDREYGFGNVVIVSDHNHMYYPYALSRDAKLRIKKVAPKTREEAQMTFGVDGPKRKYWLVLLDRGNRNELTRVPIN
jgi:hypothetical protein